MQDNTLNQNTIPTDQNTAPPSNTTAPTPSFPTETPPTDNGSAAPIDQTSTTPPQTDFAPPTPKRRALIPTILGLILLVVGVGAGLLLVQQQQIFKQKAAELCNSGTNGTLTCSQSSCDSKLTQSEKDQGYTAQCYSVTQTCSSYVPGGCYDNPNYTALSDGNSPAPLSCDNAICGVTQIDVGCRILKPSGEGSAIVRLAGTTGYEWAGRDCSTATTAPGPTTQPGWGPCGQCWGSGDCFDKPNNEGPSHPRSECQARPDGTCAWNPSTCGGSSGTAPTPAPKKACGDTCTTDSDCVSSGTAPNTPVGCRGGTCQNLNCVGKTEPGTICGCNTANACGQPCGASVGLCQAGSECGFITTASQCLAAEGNTTKQFCLPTTPGNGYTVSRCSGIAANYLVNPSGQSGTPPLTQQDVITACQQATASCTSIQAYDTNWNPLTATQLSALKGGDKVRFTVTGTTTGGVFDQARFTINGTLQTPVTTKRPNSADFYEEYTIPADATNFAVTAQIHHQVLNQWF